MKCGKGLPKQDEDLNLKEATIRLNALKACPAEGDPPHEYIGRPKHVRIKNPHWNFKFNVGEVYEVVHEHDYKCVSEPTIIHLLDLRGSDGTLHTNVSEMWTEPYATELRTNEVLLFTSPGQEFDVLIGKSRSPAKVSSRGGGQFEAELPRGSTISEGDWVTFGTLGDKPLGVVSAVLVDDVDALMTAIIVPPVSIYNIRWVYVKPGRQ
jgi:hypothetical protein